MVMDSAGGNSEDGSENEEESAQIDDEQIFMIRTAKLAQLQAEFVHAATTSIESSFVASANTDVSNRCVLHML